MKIDVRVENNKILIETSIPNNIAPESFKNEEDEKLWFDYINSIPNQELGQTVNIIQEYPYHPIIAQLVIGNHRGSHIGDINLFNLKNKKP
jgi:hypothetical protein